GVDVTDRVAPVEPVGVEVGDADPARLALLDEIGHRCPRLLDGRPGHPVGPVELEQVDPLEAETAEAPLALLANRLGPEIVLDPAVGPAFPPPPTLREDEDVLADAERGERAAHDLLRASEAVHGRGVDPVHAELDGVADRSDRLVVVDLPP